MAKEIIIGSRESILAMWQANWVADNLRRLNPHRSMRIIGIKTQGDKILDVALAKIGDKGLFTKELELAMLNGDIDLAVHSMKDLPVTLPAGLMIGAVCERVDPRDVVISRNGTTLNRMPVGARIGTSSLRRCAQLLNYRPDLKIEPLRGNLNTRLAKLDRLKLDAIILAAVGIERLGWGDRITERLSPDICLPAVGQGSIGIEIRAGDKEIFALVHTLNHFSSQAAINAERAFLKKLEGGCQIPVGALGTLKGDQLNLRGLVASPDGTNLVRGDISGPVSEAVFLGEKLAQRLMENGADKILQSVRQRLV